MRKDIEKILALARELYQDWKINLAKLKETYFFNKQKDDKK